MDWLMFGWGAALLLVALAAEKLPASGKVVTDVTTEDDDPQSESQKPAANRAPSSTLAPGRGSARPAIRIYDTLTPRSL